MSFANGVKINCAPARQVGAKADFRLLSQARDNGESDRFFENHHETKRPRCEAELAACHKAVTAVGAIHANVTFSDPVLAQAGGTPPFSQ